MFSKLLPALALAACMGAGALAPICAADTDATAVTAGKADPATTCVVDGKPLGANAKTVTVDGEKMGCCGDACMAKVNANPQYYKGVYDTEKSMYIGPKGGDSRKSIPGVGSPN